MDHFLPSVSPKNKVVRWWWWRGCERGCPVHNVLNSVLLQDCKLVVLSDTWLPSALQHCHKCMTLPPLACMPGRLVCYFCMTLSCSTLTHCRNTDDRLIWGFYFVIKLSSTDKMLEIKCRIVLLSVNDDICSFWMSEDIISTNFSKIFPIPKHSAVFFYQHLPAYAWCSYYTVTKLAML